jgi:hypothetical protein
MTFSRYNPSGYNPGDKLPAACINQHDLNLTRALDGYAGGTYAPSARLIINGGGMSIGGDGLLMDADILMPYGTNLQLGGSLTVPSAAAIYIEDLGSLLVKTRADAACDTRYSRTVYINASTPGAFDPADYAIATEQATRYWYALQTTACYLYLPLTMVQPAARIIGIEAQVKGASGHGDLPSSKPNLALVRQAPDGSATTNVASQTDTSGSVGAYEATHTITIADLTSVPVDYVWEILITSESGTNSVAGFTVFSVAITWDSNSIGL